MRSPDWRYLRDQDGQSVCAIVIGAVGFRVLRGRVPGLWRAEWRTQGGSWFPIRRRGGKYGNAGARVWYSESSAKDAIEAEAVAMTPGLLAHEAKLRTLKARLVEKGGA